MLIEAEHRWSCGRCTQVAVTRSPEPHSRLHTCAGLGGITAPLVREGTRCKVTAVEREDYVGSELVQRDQDSRPMMSVVTDYPDGRRDCVVLAPTAVSNGRATGVHG